MRLIDEYAKTFTPLIPTQESDGEGGSTTTYTEGTSITLYVRHDATIEEQIAEQDALTRTYTFLYDKGTDISYHEVLRRDEDGATFQVTSVSGEDYTPASSTLNLGYVTARRWEYE